MKKQQIKSLRLNKKSISTLQQSSIVGGTFVTCLSQFGVGICPPTTDIRSVGCPPAPTNGCPTISCDDVGICGL